MNTTKLLSQYLRLKGYSLKSVKIGTGLPENTIYPALGKNSRRALRADEFLLICKFLQVDPMSFYPTEEKATIEPQVAAS